MNRRIKMIRWIIHTALPHMGDDDDWGLLWGLHLGWLIPVSIIILIVWVIL